MLKLIKRSPEYLDGYREYCREFFDSGEKYFRPTNPELIDEEWFRIAKDRYEKKEATSFHFWAVDGEKFIGEFQLRTQLTREIMFGIGSVGYAVRVGERLKGYGTEILRQGLQIARSHGMDRVIVNINDENVVSAHICEKLGGVPIDKIHGFNYHTGHYVMRRYWIYL